MIATTAMTRTPEHLVAQATLPSPLGPLTAAATAHGLALLWFDAPGLGAVPVDPAQPVLAHLARELAAYWLDPATPFTVPLDLQGTPFQQAVWRALTAIPAGETCSYGDIASRIGRPSAVRAVGAANGANPVGIVVPCHRVIGRNGTLTGYAAGLPRKAALLQHESAQRPLAAA
jgi:methylated-DNA-[protein]-cysteine S-methyltransferase